MDKIIIFGSGNTGKRTYDEYQRQAEILFFLDNDVRKSETEYMGIPVHLPSEDCLRVEYDWIIIASVFGKFEIRAQLRKMGVAEEKIKEYTRMPDTISPFLQNLADDFVLENVGGDCAEVGVFRGDTARKINRFFSERTLYLFDTFDGFCENDVLAEQKFGFSSAMPKQYSDTSEEIVMQGMAYPEKVKIYKGFFPDSARNIRTSFCFVRIDLDLYTPTVAALDFFTPLMVNKGIIIVHDYFGNQYMGIRKAVREYLECHPKLYKVPIGDTMSIVIVGY